MNDRMMLVSNSGEFTYFKTESLQDLIKREELLELSLQDWNELFIEKDGKSFPDALYQVLKAKILYYDKSKNINSFTFNNKEYWFPKSQRLDLHTVINCKPEIVPIILSEDNIVELSLNKAEKLLNDLELYAAKCYINTLNHLKNIKQLRSVEDMIKYNYTKGYPEKVIFNE